MRIVLARQLPAYCQKHFREKMSKNIPLNYGITFAMLSAILNP